MHASLEPVDPPHPEAVSAIRMHIRSNGVCLYTVHRGLDESVPAVKCFLLVIEVSSAPSELKDG